MCILKPALLPHANTQSLDLIDFLPVDYATSRMPLCTSLAVYNQIKKLIMGECASVLGQKKSSPHRRVVVLQIVFRLSDINFKPVGREVKTKSAEPCIDARLSCLGFTISNVPHLSTT